MAVLLLNFASSSVCSTYSERDSDRISGSMISLCASDLNPHTGQPWQWCEGFKITERKHVIICMRIVFHLHGFYCDLVYRLHQVYTILYCNAPLHTNLHTHHSYAHIHLCTLRLKSSECLFDPDKGSSVCHTGPSFIHLCFHSVQILRYLKQNKNYCHYSYKYWLYRIMQLPALAS